MPRVKSIGMKILLASVANVVFAASLLGGVAYVAICRQSESSITQIEKLLMENYDEGIRNQVETVVSALKSVRAQIDAGQLSRDVGLAVATDVVRQARYGKEGYFWADTVEGVNVALLGNKDVEGKSRIDFVDDNGTKIIREFIRMATTSGSGYLDYFFPKKGQTEALPKRGYVLLSKEFDWIVGTGNYTDDIHAFVAGEREKAHAARRRSVVLLGAAFLASLAASAGTSYFIGRGMSRPILLVTSLIERTAALDITSDTRVDHLREKADETGVIARSVGSLQEALRTSVRSLQDDARQLTESADELRNNTLIGRESVEGVMHAVHDFALGAQSQASDTQSSVQILGVLAQHIDRAVAGATQLRDHSKEVEDRNRESVASVQGLGEEFRTARTSIENLNSNVGKLAEQSTQIGAIVGTIQNVAKQTNLLALNAAIEAARAGEAGRGFAVVADEIRSLAEQTTRSVQQIEGIISEILGEIQVTLENMTLSKEAVSTADDMMGQVLAASQSIERAISQTFAKLDEVSQVIVEINKAKNSVVDAVSGISSVTEENAASAEEISATMERQNALVQVIHQNADRLNEIAKGVERIASRFKL